MCVDTLAAQLHLDFAGLVTPAGSTVYRSGSQPGDPQVLNPAAALALERRTAVAGTLVLNRDELAAEHPDLAERARIVLVATPKAAPRPETQETEGMCLVSAEPVYAGNTLIGVLYGGVLLNRNNEIVDRVRDTVFQQEIYRGEHIGTATIFFRDMRIATNVLDAQGERAIGTRASAEVNDRVLAKGERWTARAFVVRDWYITAYEPITDVLGRTAGMLYVGVLEGQVRGPAAQRHAGVRAHHRVGDDAGGAPRQPAQLPDAQPGAAPDRGQPPRLQGGFEPRGGSPTPAASSGCCSARSRKCSPPCGTATGTRRPKAS